MNRNFRSIQFLRLINPLVSAGKISGEDAAFLTGCYRDSKDGLILTFIENIPDSESVGKEVESFLMAEDLAQ